MLVPLCTWTTAGQRWRAWQQPAPAGTIEVPIPVVMPAVSQQLGLAPAVKREISLTI